MKKVLIAYFLVLISVRCTASEDQKNCFFQRCSDEK